MKKAIMGLAQGLALGALFSAGTGWLAWADQLPGEPPPKAAGDQAADNTGKNRQAREAMEPTADQQPNNRSDLELTRLIRRSLVRDDSLSMSAHNVKIVAQNGTVTLKGSVRSADEKKMVEQKAAEVAGAANVKSELEVAPKK